MINNYIKLAVLPLFAVLLTACSKDDTDDDQPPQEVTRWECILFGSYPANEVVSDNFDAVDDYALVEGDVIVDATLYSQLENAQWTNDDTEIDGKRYHRLNAAGTVAKVLWNEGDKIKLVGMLSGGSYYQRDFTTSQDEVPSADFSCSDWNPDDNVTR